MKKTLITLAGLAAMSLPALAMGEAVVELDTNGDGMLSIEEVQAVYPDVSDATFAEADVNADGLLDEAEVTAAQENGLMPAKTEG